MLSFEEFYKSLNSMQTLMNKKQIFFLYSLKFDNLTNKFVNPFRHLCTGYFETHVDFFYEFDSSYRKGAIFYRKKLKKFNFFRSYKTLNLWSAHRF